MIKPLKVSDKSVRRFKTHKQWTYDNITSADEILLEQENLDGPISLYVDEQTVLSSEHTISTTKLKVSRGKRYAPTDTFYPVGHKLHDPTYEYTNSDGSYQRVVYNSIKHLFYNEYGVSSSLNSTGGSVKNPLMVFGSETGNYMMQAKSENQIFNTNEDNSYERRVMSDEIIVIQFNSTQMGEKIKPGEFRIRDYSSPYGVLEIVDDGATNLVISSSSFNEIKEVTGSLSDIKNIRPDNKIFDFNDLTFGYKLASAGKYFISGQPVMPNAPTETNSGRSVLYKLDDDTGQFRVLKQFLNPFTQGGLSIEIQNDNTGFLMTELEGLLLSEDYSINDNFGDAVELNHNCCVIGSSQSHIRGVCSEKGTTGHIFVYDKEKGGADHWGLVNIIEGEPGAEFGASVSIKGNYMAVGSPGHNNSEGAIYLFKKNIRTKEHPWKRISDSYDDYDWSDDEGVFVGKPVGAELEKNNKWVSRWNVTSLVPNADTLNHFYRDDSELLHKRCTEAGLIQYNVSQTEGVQDHENGVVSSGWQTTGILATPTSDSSESSTPYPVDIYDSSDNLLGHITYTGKPKIMSLYFSFGENNSMCISGTIDGNRCRMTGGVLANQCTEPGFTEYRVSTSENIEDQTTGVTSSVWMKPGILSISGSDSSTSSAPYPVDVYDSTNTLVGHLTYTGKPSVMNLYFRTSDEASTCVYGKIEGNICVLPTELVISGSFKGNCSEYGYVDHEVSPVDSIDDQSNGVVSSTWKLPGVVSLPPTTSTSDSTPYPVDVYNGEDLLGHITFTGTPPKTKIYFSYGNECFSGKIVAGVCRLDDNQPLIGKQVSGDLNDYRVSPKLSILDQEAGVVSSTWASGGILSIPPPDFSNASTPFAIDVYDELGGFMGHITYTGHPSMSTLYFTTDDGDRYFGPIVGGRCDLRQLVTQEDAPDIEVSDCTESGFNKYAVSSELFIDDSDWGVKSSTWAYNGNLSVSHANTKYGTHRYVVDVYDFKDTLMGTITYFGNPDTMNIYFKRSGSTGCESGVIVDNKCKLTPYDIVDTKTYKELPCDSINASEIETFGGDPISTEGTITGYPPPRYAEDEDGAMSPKHSIGDVTWDLVEVIKIPGSRRLGGEVKLTSDCIYATTPDSRFKYCSVLRKLDEPTDCGVGWKHTYNITKDGIYNFNTDPVGLGDGFSDVSVDINDNEVTITATPSTTSDAIDGFVYRINTPLNESSNTELINHGGVYVPGKIVTLTLTPGLHDIYVGRTKHDESLVGHQSRVNLAINPIPYDLPKRETNVKYPYEYEYNVDGNFGVSLDANANLLIIGDSFDREYVDPANKQDRFKAGSTYVYSTTGGEISFVDKIYSDVHEEFQYSSEYGRSVSLKGTDFVVGSPCTDASEISILDGGENVGVRDFRRGTRNISERYYTSEENIFTDAECTWVGGNLPDAVVKISVDTITIDLELMSEFMISAPFIETDKNSLYTLKIPTSYTGYEVSKEVSVADDTLGITSSTWTTTGMLWLPPPDTALTSTPKPVDVYDVDNKFMGHITYTGNFLSDEIYFVANGTPYIGNIVNSRCRLSPYTENLGAVTRGVYRDLTRFEDGKLWFYVDVIPEKTASDTSGWSETGIEFAYYANRNAEEGNVYYYRASATGLDKLANVKTNKYPYKIRHQYGLAVSLSSSYIYVGCPVMGNFPLSELEAFEGSDIGLFEQCSTIYSEYGDIAWGRLSNMDVDIAGKVLAYDVASIRDSERVYVGNVFYKNGIAVITNTSDYFSNMFTGSNDSGFEVSFRGTHAIYENEILCSVSPAEFNVSTNPTSVAFDDIDYDINSDKKFDIKDLSYIYRYMIGSLVDVVRDVQETYTIGKETLETICREFGIPFPSQIDIDAKREIPIEVSFGLLDIRRYDKGSAGNKLRYGDTIVPGDSIILSSGYVHTIRPVQSLNSVAKFTGVTPSEILTANPGIASESLKLGQVVNIPSGGDYTPGIKFEEGNNTNWPNDDLILTESEDLVLMNVLLRSTERSVDINEYKSILAKLESLEDRGLLDIDGDGLVSHLDAKLIVRYFVGRTGADLTDGLINTFTNSRIKQTRSSAYQITEFLDDRTGKNRGIEILQDFVDYRENDAKDQLGSYLAPYVTTVGLYSGLDLVMVAKLSKPVKVVPNYPINFLVKYDT